MKYRLITLEQFNTCEDLVKRRILSDLQSNYEARRETIATAALQGLLADSTASATYDQYVDSAVKFADALIAKLGSTPLPVSQHVPNAKS